MKTLKFRLKDKHAELLDEMASEATYVWNYVNALCYYQLQKTGKFLSAYDVAPYTAGTSKVCSLHSQTVQAITETLITNRKTRKKAILEWRISKYNKKGKPKSLGWIPFKKSAIKYTNGQLVYQGQHFSFWDSYGLSKYKDHIKSGCFVEDVRGRWYVCLVVDVVIPMKSGNKAIGIDLGLKFVATCSDGYVVKNPAYYRKNEEKLGKLQRAKKKKQVRNIHAKIKNSRMDYLQKESTKLVNENALIVVGNLSASKLVKTNLAKSVLDAGFAAFRTMIKYKCQQAGSLFEEVNEKHTTQMCSCCGVTSSSSPKGRAGLGIRDWICMECGTPHNRDVNAAMNILRLGYQTLGVGIPTFRSGGCQYRNVNE